MKRPSLDPFAFDEGAGVDMPAAYPRPDNGVRTRVEKPLASPAGFAQSGTPSKWLLYAGLGLAGAHMRFSKPRTTLHRSEIKDAARVRRRLADRSEVDEQLADPEEDAAEQ